MDEEEIKKRLKKLEEENEKLKEIIRNRTSGSQKRPIHSGGDVSRRQFLKKLGAGAAGIGALSLSPAVSQLKLTKNSIQNGGQGNFTSVSTDKITVNKSMSAMSLSSSQTISDGNSAKVKFDTSEIDELGGVDTSNHTITVPDNGKWRVQATYTWDKNEWSSTGEMGIIIYKNGSRVVKESGTVPGGAGIHPKTTINRTLKLNAGDSISIYSTNKSGGSKTIRSTFVQSTYFKIIREG